MSLSCTTLFFLYILILPLSFHVCSYTTNYCLADGSNLMNKDGIILVSQTKIFEFGFFTPNGKIDENNKYLGIWYYNSNPKIVVWVANRDKPLSNPNGTIVIKDGNAQVLGADGSIYWQTNTVALQDPTQLCLNDLGNLILSSHERKFVLWQSFDHPTNTLLPGMSVYGSLKLISWRNNSSPAQGSAEFVLQTGNDSNANIIQEGYHQYWDIKTDYSAKIPYALSKLLDDRTGKASLPNNTRLVINFTRSSGQIQLWKRGNSNESWVLDWVEPKDRCNFHDVCGNFGSCNSNYGSPCKCLPGFRPNLLQEWNSGCYIGGCVAKSGSPNSFTDTFLKLPRMKVGTVDCSASVESNCEKQCLTDCTCVAYAYGIANCTGMGSSTEKRCLTWTNLTRLQEEFSQGITLFVRVPASDIGSSSRNCTPCGAYAIPYPLSTNRSKCGDSMYSNFHCNSDTGQVNFSTPTGTFRVALIDPDAKTFTVQVMQANGCDSRNSYVLPSNSSMPFEYRNCSIIKDNPLVQLGQPFIMVEIGWKVPLEPSCSASADCHPWPHTSCKATKGGTRRCKCGSRFHWDGSNLKCVKAVLHMKILIPCVAVPLAIFFLCGVFFVYNHKHRRRIAKNEGTIEFEGDDSEGVDVPFFSWGIIQAATSNFADANMLGTGGFGSVFRGKLPDGKEIAVKRLSSVSTQGVAEFRTEVVLIAKLQHRNLVRLLGYCVKANENILIYEYMLNGSLDTCLFDQNFSVYLDWEKRFNIIFGIARGLVYLHQDSRCRIIHRDLKPSNILLDEELNPKISDFGVARIIGRKETELNTNKVVGTYGYMPPEYACEGFFSIKSDVFSFGVVVLEIVSGIRNSRIAVFEEGLSLLGHAWRLWTEDKGLEFIDPTLKESCNPIEVLTCIRVALLCVQDDPADRPTMPNVVLMLSNGGDSIDSVPKKPAYFTRTSSSEVASSSSAGASSSFSNGSMITVSTVGR